MPRGLGEHLWDEEVFYEALERLNRFTPAHGQWRVTRARREHTDVFDEPIAAGEDYYSREIGPGWSDVVRISRLSMERILYAVVLNNPRMTELITVLHLLSLREIAAAVYAQLGEKSTEAEG